MPNIFPSFSWDPLSKLEPSVSLLLSLCVQVILVPMGLKRKHSSSKCLRLFLLCAYSFSDWITRFSFLTLVGKYGSGCYDEFSDLTCIIRAFLAPFLLLHLGGSDTITAYSMEDNELWLRTLLSMLAQLFASFYIFLLALSLKPTSLNYVAIPVFVAGIIKYGEKIWALGSASAERLRDFLAVSTPSQITTPDQEKVLDIQMLHFACNFFNRDKRFFVGLGPTSYNRRQNHRSFYDKFDSKSAFKIIELELGFMYDFLYTKSFINHSRWGRLLRLTTFSSLVTATVTYCMIDKHEYLPKYEKKYVLLIFLLLFGALGLEIYSLFLFLLSDWNVIWLTTQSPSHPLPRLAFKLISFCGWSVKKRRCSNSILQYNLISHCLEQRNRSYYRKFLNFIKTMATSSLQPISNNLETQIFQQLKQKLEGSSSTLEDGKKVIINEVGWSLNLDLDETILLWHIATTDICYHSSKNKQREEASKSSVLLSNFLAYLLVHCPSLFPSGMSKIRKKATSEDVLKFVEDEKLMLKNLELKIEEAEESKSMLFDACRLARQLEKVEESKKWEIIGNVWVELLARVSCECEWYEHAKMLTQGGNLLTRVWILMHHLEYDKPAELFTIRMEEDPTRYTSTRP